MDLGKAIGRLKPAVVTAAVDAALRMPPPFDADPPVPLTLLRGDAWTGVTTAIDEDGYRAVLVTAGGRRSTSRSCTVIGPDGGVIGAFAADPAAVRVAAAAAGLAAPRIHGPAPARVAILGGGPLGAACAAAVAAAVEVAQLVVHDPEGLAIDGARAAGDAASAVRDATLIVTATNARDPVLRADWVAEGASIIAVGADRQGRRELDYRLIADAAFVACDAPHVARTLADDLRDCVAEGHLDWQEVTALASVLAGDADARVTADDVVVVKLIDPTPGLLALARRAIG